MEYKTTTPEQYTITKLANIALSILLEYRDITERCIRDESPFPEIDMKALEETYTAKRKEIYKLVGWEYHD